MANYVEVKNNNGTVTIDDTHARLVKTRTISITATRTVFPVAAYNYIRGYIDNKYILGSVCAQQFTLNSNESFVAIRAKKKHDNVAVMGGFISANKYQVSLLGSVENTNTYESDYLLDFYGTVPSSGGTSNGLEVFNASGTKIFDSDFYTMDVVGTFRVVDKKLELFTEAENRFYCASGYGIDSHAIVVNSSINKVCQHPRIATPFVILYGMVFGASMYLEKRVTQDLSFLYSGGSDTPHGMSHSGTGIILNTKNI